MGAICKRITDHFLIVLQVVVVVVASIVMDIMERAIVKKEEKEV